MGEMGDAGGGGGDMGGGGDIGGGGDMGGGGDAGGAGGILGGGEEASSMPTTDYGGGGETTGAGGSGGGMLSFAVSDNMAGLAGSDTSSSKVSTTPAEAGSALDKSTQPANASASTTTAKTPTSGDTAAAAKKDNMGATVAKEFGKALSQEDNTPSNNQRPYQMPGTTYGALFGSPNMMSRQSSAPAQIAPIQGGGSMAPPAAVPAVQIPTAMPPPPLQVQPAQAPQVPQVPMTVSDIRAKQRVQDAHKSMDELLQRVYTNVVTKRKR